MLQQKLPDTVLHVKLCIGIHRHTGIEVQNMQNSLVDDNHFASSSSAFLRISCKYDSM